MSINSTEQDKLIKRLRKNKVSESDIELINSLIGSHNSWESIEEQEEELIKTDKNYAKISERISVFYSKNQWFSASSQINGKTRAMLKLLERAGYTPEKIDEELYYDWEDL